MTATNHALTGAVIGFAVGNPWIALPLAFLSHFICDSIPHFGVNRTSKEWVSTKAFRYFLVCDALLCIVLVVILALLHPNNWFWAAAAAFVATSPDLMWVMQFFRGQTHRDEVPRESWNSLMKFHSKIQWFEKPPGAVVEFAWAPAMIVLLTHLS